MALNKLKKHRKERVNLKGENQHKARKLLKRFGIVLPAKRIPGLSQPGWQQQCAAIASALML